MVFSKKSFATLFLSYLIFSVQATPANGYAGWIIGGVAAGTAAVVGAPIVVSGLGFTATGIAANSIGASMMSAWAPTAAGGVVATLQSVGALGLSAGAKAGIGAAGAAVGAAVGAAADDDDN